MPTPALTSQLEEQLSMFPPEAYEITLKYGIVHASSHVQAQIEVRAQADDRLVGMMSWPHRDLAMWTELQGEVDRELNKLFNLLVDPF